MASLFGGLLDARVRQRQGKMQGEEMAQQIEQRLAEQQREAKQRELAELVSRATKDHMNAETRTLEDALAHPKKPRPFYDSVRGVMVNDDGTVVPLKNLPPRPAGSKGTGPSDVTKRTHAATQVHQQITDKNREISEANSVLKNGLFSNSTPADTANYNTAADRLPTLKHSRDSLNTVFGNIATATQRAAGVGADAPVDPVLPVVDQAAYDRGIAAGHTDAEIAQHYTIPSTVKRHK